jgi:hypothetical protein
MQKPAKTDTYGIVRVPGGMLMNRRAIFLSIVLATTGVAASVARAQDDDAQALITQCSDPAPDAVDACLERARVAEETAPSKDLQKLVAHLIELEATAPSALPAGPAPSAEVSVPDDNAAPTIDTTEPQAPGADDAQNDDPTPPAEQPTPTDMSPPDNAAPPPSPADTEPPAPPAGSPHN